VLVELFSQTLRNDTLPVASSSTPIWPDQSFDDRGSSSIMTAIVAPLMLMMWMATET